MQFGTLFEQGATLFAQLHEHHTGVLMAVSGLDLLKHACTGLVVDCMLMT